MIRVFLPLDHDGWWKLRLGVESYRQQLELEVFLYRLFCVATATVTLMKEVYSKHSRSSR